MHKSRESFWLFIFGLGASLFTQLIGYITFSELALLFAGPYYILKFWKALKGTRGQVLFILAVLWLFSAVMADQYADTPFSLAVRGWARPIFIGTAIVVFYQLMRARPQRAQWFFLGYAFSCAISIYIFKPGSIDITERIHDITIVGSFERQIIPIVLAGAQFLFFRYGGDFPVWSGLGAIGLGAMSIFFGSRSGGAVVAMAGVVSLSVHWVIPVKNGQYRMNGAKVPMFAAMLGVAACLVFFSYSVAAQAGLLGAQAYEKYSAQKSSTFGLLLGGRTEAIGGILAIRDNPIIGHGSWPIDYNGYTEDAADLAGMVLDQETELALQHGYIRIPAHSHLLEAWVEHGLLAALFWWYVLYLMVRLAVKGIFRFPELLPGAVLLLVEKGWDVFFSPIGGRVALAATLAFFAALADAADRADHNKPSRPSRFIPRKRLSRSQRLAPDPV